jgi:tetratricopeptide (TPR) repeat protein
MSKYVLKDTTDPFGNQKLVLRQETADGEFAPIPAQNATQSLLALPKSLLTEGLPRLYEIGYQHVKAEEYEQALAFGSLLVTKCDNQTRVEAYQVRGTALFGLGLYRDAIDDLTIAINGVQNDARYRILSRKGLLHELLITRAECYRETNDLVKALDDNSAAIHAAPSDNYDSYIGRARVFSAMKTYELAIADFNIAMKGGNRYVYLGRAQAYAALGDIPHALADFESYSKLVADAYSYREFGKYLLSLGRSQDALQQFQKAVDMAPTHWENYQLRAEALRSIGNHSAAEQDDATALKLKVLDDKHTTYLQAAKEMHGLGFTKVPAEADTRTRPNYLTAIVLGVLTLVGSYVVLAVVYSVVSNSDAGCGGIGIIILPLVLAGWVIRERIQKPRQQARNAEIYFREIAAREAQMPAFSEFFKEYIKARNGSELSQLEQRTRHLFEEGGAAQGFSLDSIPSTSVSYRFGLRSRR